MHLQMLSKSLQLIWCDAEPVLKLGILTLWKLLVEIIDIKSF